MRIDRSALRSRPAAHIGHAFGGLISFARMVNRNKCTIEFRRVLVQLVIDLQIFGIPGAPEIEPGCDLAALSFDTAVRAGTPLIDGDVLIVTSKIVSKAEGRIVDLDTVQPSSFAREWSVQWDKDPAVTELVLQESRRIVRQIGPILITETHHGFVCANSGIDQ